MGNYPAQSAIVYPRPTIRCLVFAVFLLVGTAAPIRSLSNVHSARLTGERHQLREAAISNPPPFGLPFASPPGPSTWLLGQTYGNTIGAYRQRDTTYAAGQGLHFGIDFSAACGTPVVAIGDGVVSKVDAPSHGAAPHNLMIDHANGYASFYGHLLERPALAVGQAITRGQVVARTGDPDETCTSRPHLHLEIRDTESYHHLYNPVVFIEADWDSLALVGSFGRGFERDLDNPRRWQFLEDQPEIVLWQPLLNDYAHPWPPDWGGR
jgi:murein DD-endopeptidase MepM/ murein hydrolase activator NlpD